MDTWLQDLRSALRGLRRSPAFTLLFVVSTALGIGMVTLAFGAGYVHLLRPLPFPDDGRLVAVSMERAKEEIAVPSRVSYPELLDLRARCRSFTGAAGYRQTGLTLFVDRAAGAAERVPAAEVSGDFFRVLGKAPALGRALRPEDERPLAPAVVVLGDALWRRSFGGDPRWVGRTISVDERPARVVGVMPPDFAFPGDQQAWVPLAHRLPDSPPRAIRDLRMTARLRPGVSLEEAEREVRAVGRELARRYPASTAGWSGHVRPLRSNYFSPETRLALRYLAGASAFILLIAGANLTHLLRVRRVAQQQETAIRAAFGAGPWRLARRIFTESALLAGAGGLLGAAFAAVLLGRLQAFAERTGAPYWIHYEAGPPAFLFAAATTAVFALLLSLPAALRERRRDLSPALKEASWSGGGRRRLRTALVVTQVALSVLLSTGAALTVRSLLALHGESGGVRGGNLVTFWTLLPGDRYADGAARAERTADLLERLRAAPGITAVTASDDVPHSFGGGDALLSLPGSPAPALSVLANAVGTGYFSTLGAPLLRGRDLTAAEIAAGAGAAVVNQTLERAVWPGDSAVGKRILLRRGSAATPFTVVGVAADIRHRMLSLPAPPAVYIPLACGLERRVGFLVRTAAPRQRLLPAAARQIHAADPSIPVFGEESLDELRAGVMIPDWQRAQAAILCGSVALFLALLGVYGTLAAVVAQNLPAIGIRLALGATRGHVMRQIVGRGLAPALAGIALGLAAAPLVGRFLSRFLYQVSPTDPLSFAAIAVLAFDAAFIACYLPARRVLEVDPAVTLRRE
jgi:putative ABC transport system permease protein